jgi:hypothetical protein
MKKTIMFLGLLAFSLNSVHSNENYFLNKSTICTKIQKEIHVKLKSKEGCVFAVDGTVTLNWGSFAGFSGSISVSGPNPPCPNGKYEFAFVAQATPGGLTLVNGNMDIFNRILNDQQNLAIPIWNAMQI